MIELCGTENEPLMQPFIQIDQEELALTGLQWSREHFWIPSGHKATVKFTVLTPVGERGFAMRFVCHSANRLPLKTWCARSME